MFDFSNEPKGIAGLGQVSTLLEGWMPPSRENWLLILRSFQWLWPIVRFFSAPTILVGLVKWTL